MERMAQESKPVRDSFLAALDTKVKNLKERGEMAHPLYDKDIFSKIRGILGGRIRWLVSGGAPLPQDVMDFMVVAFSCPMF